jgi:hypothetical protein
VVTAMARTAESFTTCWNGAGTGADGVVNTRPHRCIDEWVGPVFSLSNSPESHSTRERDLAVTAAAIMTRTAATAIAMIHRTQSMPGLPSPPNAV